VYPCTNCNKRGDGAGCTFVGRGPRGKSQRGQASPTLVQDRLQHLENLVMSLAQKQKIEHEQSPDQIPDFNAVPQAADVNGPNFQTPTSLTSNGTQPSRDTGTLVVNDEGTSYFESADWRAILNEVSFRSIPTLQVSLLSNHELTDSPCRSMESKTPSTIMSMRKRMMKGQRKTETRILFLQTCCLE